MNKTLKQVRELKTHIKRLEREHDLALEKKSFFHKELTGSLPDCSPSTKLAKMNNSVCQRVRDNVPSFSEEELDVRIALKRYLRGCDLALEGYRPEEEQTFLNSLIVRLHGKTFEVDDSTPLKTLGQLKDLLGELYFKQRDLDSINDEVREMRQRRGERVRQFAWRLEVLRGHARSCMLTRDTPKVTDVLLLDFERKMNGSFVMGLSDSGSERTQGSVKIKHDILMGILFKLHVVGDNTELAADGALGRDNMWNIADLYRRCGPRGSEVTYETIGEDIDANGK